MPIGNSTTTSKNFTTLYPGGSSSQVLPTVPYGNANVESFLATGSDTGGNVVGNITATGNISTTGNITGNYFIGNGSQLTGITSSYGNANVATLLAAFGSNTISTTGTVTAGNITGANVLTGGLISATGNITGANVLTGGLISATGNITGANVLTGGVISATGNITGANVLTGGVISATGNITGNYFIGNGSQLTGITVAAGTSIVNGNSNVTVSANSNVTIGVQGVAGIATFANTGAYILGVTSATGNITGNYFIGNGSQLTGIAAGYGNANVVTLLAAFGSNTLSTTGTVTAGNITGGNILTGGVISASGNVSGNYFLGNGSQLTGLPATYGNANVATFLADFGSNNISTTGTVTAGNITGGNILTGGLISAAGNISGNVFLGNGSQLTGITSSYGNANVVTLLSAFGSNTVSTTGTVTAGDITGANVLTGGQVSASGNITGANVNTNNIVGTAVTITSTGVLNLAPTGNITANSKNINSLADPVSDQDAATKIYVDNIASGLDPKASVALATATTLAAYTYNNGTAGVGATITATANGALSIDGSTPSVSDRVLIKNETGGDAPYNGIYVVTAVGSAGAVFVLTRSTDMNQGSEFPSAFTFVEAGSVNADSGFVCTTNAPVVLGTTNITWVQFSSSGSYTANTSAGLSLIGSQFNALVDNSTTAFDGGGNIVVKTSANLTTPNIGAATGTSLSTTGNITGNVFIGNGSQLTDIISSYGNANVVTLLAAFGSNTISTTGTVTAGNITGGNVLTGGLISATGNISGNVFLGNGSQLTGITGTYGNANVATLLAAFGSNTVSTTGTVTAGNITGANILTGGLISAAGNISGNVFLGNGSQLTGITTTYGNANVVSLLAAFGSNSISTTGNITSGNLITGGAGGDISGANNILGTTFSASANITGSYFIGNGSQLTGGYGNANVVTLLAAFGSNTVSTTGNITGGNVTVNTGNLTAAGVGNMQVGNIITTQQQILTTQARDPSVTNVTTGNLPDPGRIFMGTGYMANVANGVGNTSPVYDLTNFGRGTRLTISDTLQVGNANVIARGLAVQNYVVYSANVTSGTSAQRVASASFQTAVGGGSAANSLAAGLNQVICVAASLQIGGGTGNISNIGNIRSEYQIGVGGFLTVNTNSTAGNCFMNSCIMTNNGVANTIIGYTTSSLGSGTGWGNVIGYYMPGSTSVYGYSMANTARAATNYYFLRNDDTLAQCQLGSLRSYNEFNYTAGANTGGITISKTNGQVQQINLTGNITSIAYSNFVTSASDGTNTKEQTDTVTLIFNQGATGNFGVTFPTGATYKYANNITVLSSFVANSVSLVSVTATRISGTTTYLTTISPGFV